MCTSMNNITKNYVNPAILRQFMLKVFFYQGAPKYYNDLVLFAHYTSTVSLFRGGCRWPVEVVARQAESQPSPKIDFQTESSKK